MGDDNFGHLERLVSELDARGLHARVVRTQSGRAFVRVINPNATSLAENVTCRAQAAPAARIGTTGGPGASGCTRRKTRPVPRPRSHAYSPRWGSERAVHRTASIRPGAPLLPRLDGADGVTGAERLRTLVRPRRLRTSRPKPPTGSRRRPGDGLRSSENTSCRPARRAVTGGIPLGNGTGHASGCASRTSRPSPGHPSPPPAALSPDVPVFPGVM